MKEIKIKMHTVSNKIAYFICELICVGILPMVITVAKNQAMQIFGIVISLLLFAFVNWVFIDRYKIFAYAIFKEECVELYSPFKKIAVYKYDEVLASPAWYTSVIENKKYLTFTPKTHNAIVTQIDTSKYGNLMQINKLKVIYCPATKELLDFLKTKENLLFCMPKN